MRDLLMSFHFDEYYLYVEATDYGGGYSKRSKRWATPLQGEPALIGKDFKVRRKTAWSGGNIHIPNCLVYLDEQESWWKKIEKLKQPFV
jgi:hypothetical protein